MNDMRRILSLHRLTWDDSQNALSATSYVKHSRHHAWISLHSPNLRNI
jgi:hypothetical protein